MTRARGARAGGGASGIAMAALLATALAAGCARSLPPPGGPVDTTPPFVAAASPGDSAVGVSQTSGVEFLFSEPMDRASVRDNVRIYPPPGLPNYDWKGRRFRVEWGESLRAGTTYHVFLSGKARDQRGVMMGTPVQICFSTGDSLAPGRIAGVVRAKTLGTRGVPVLLFPDSLGARPDTTRALEPTYQTETDTTGVYEFAGLPLDEGFTVHAFYDRNGDQYYDPDQDVLADHGEAVRLTPEGSVADSIVIVAVDPRAPAILDGVVDTPDSLARFQIEVRAAADSSLVTRVERTGPGKFQIRVPPGRYRLAARRESVGAKSYRGGVAIAAPTFPEAVARIEDVVTVGPEEERGPFILSFPSAAAPPPPAPEEESR